MSCSSTRRVLFTLENTWRDRKGGRGKERGGRRGEIRKGERNGERGGEREGQRERKKREGSERGREREEKEREADLCHQPPVSDHLLQSGVGILGPHSVQVVGC